MEIWRRLPIFKQKYEKLCDDAQEMRDYFMEKIDEHKRMINYEANDDPVDYAEAFLKEKHKLEKEGNFDSTFTDKQLYSMLLDLWVSGQETTSNTLTWICLYLINRPEIQQKIHQELDEKINSDKIITIDDKNDLPYLNAVILESQRYCNLVPLKIFSKTTKDVKIHGYKIPKGTGIVNQIGSVLEDERYFKNPEEFLPERFLDKNGKIFIPIEFIPFGIGKRSCLAKPGGDVYEAVGGEGGLLPT
uniref:Cytochrome P450 n=1 Tax=Panagrolaimus sp. JU765 TaxID=591449 RepID=A0AC34RHU4_9BILA